MTIQEAYIKGYSDGEHDGYYSQIIEDGIEKKMYNPPQEPDTGHCKDCKYFHCYHEIERVPHIIAHNVCYRWGNKCFTKEDGYCYLFEPKEESEDKE